MEITLNNESLNDIRAKYPDCFCDQSWYKNEAFASEKITGTWEVSLEPIIGSFDKTYDEQVTLLKKGGEVPPAAVLAKAVCQNFKETGKRAFENIWVRSSSCDADGCRVFLYFDAKGLSVSDLWGSYRYDLLGLASAWKVDSGTLDSLEPLENLSLGALTPLGEAIETVKKAGYVVYKLM